MILELEETKEWLRVEGVEDDATIDLLINSAEAYLKNATGKIFDHANHQAKLFCLILVTDWYENRVLIGAKVGDKVRFIIESMITQLQYGGESDV